jgi:hypothetical protein
VFVFLLKVFPAVAQTETNFDEENYIQIESKNDSEFFPVQIETEDDFETVPTPVKIEYKNPIEKSEEQLRYEKSSASEKTIYDIANYGKESVRPYNIENYRIAKTDVLSEANLKEQERKAGQTKFYIALQANVFMPDTFDLKEPQYFGASLPTIDAAYNDAMNFLPNGTRSGLYAKISSNTETLYPYISLGIRTNNNFRFEIAHTQTKFKLQNDNTEGGIIPSYLSGYDLLTRNVNMDFTTQLYLLNGYVDLKFNRVWVYFGAGIGMVNNQLKKFTASIEKSDNSETYVLESLVDDKAVYKTATMLTFGTYFKIFEGAYLDIGVKKISADKVSTSKDYNLTKIINATSVSTTTKVSMNFLETDIDPYLVSIGLRYEF